MVGNPVLLYAPSLPLTNNIQIGPWLIGVPPEGVRWQSDKFRSLTLAYVRSMEAAYGKGALVWHGDRGLDGNMPSVRQWQSLELALTFGL